LTNQRDLALAYSPGVAAASEAIAPIPRMPTRYTARCESGRQSINQRTAVLGLGNIGRWPPSR